MGQEKKLFLGKEIPLIRKFLIFTVVLAASISANAAIIPFFELGLNTYNSSITDAQVPEYSRELSLDHQIDWIDIIVTNHVDSTLGASDIEFMFRERFPDASAVRFELNDSVSGDGTYRIFEGSFSPSGTRGWIDFSVNHQGETANAYSDVQWQVFVSEVPEPSSLALLSLGGLALMRRRSRGV